MRHRNGDSTPALNELTPKFRATKARAPDPIGNRENLFDNGASYHIVADRHMFTSYTELPADADAVTGAFTDIQKPIGIGSIRMNLGKRQFIELEDVRHIPTASSNLISESHLLDQGYNQLY